MPDSRPHLYVCITCRQGEGARLHAALAGLLAGQSEVGLREVTCFASCSKGCTAAIAAPGKWSYLLGELSLAHAEDLVTYAGVYADHPNGAVLPSRRPDSLRGCVVARLPALPA
jgi:predicted metal-binding protein